MNLALRLSLIKGEALAKCEPVDVDEVCRKDTLSECGPLLKRTNMLV